MVEITNNQKCKGVIYILTNPSFPKYVKIGYADDVNKRLIELNRSECIPFAFRLYAYYEVNQRLTDIKIHEMIDKLNPDLRSIDTFNGKPRKKEFYAIPKETAYNILESIASISDTKDRLHLVESETIEIKEEAIEIDNTDYNLSDFLSNKRPEVVDMYNKFITLVKQRMPKTYTATTPNYIALRNENAKNICEIHLLKNRLLLTTRIPLNLEFQIGEKVPETYLWSLNYKIYIENAEKINLAVGAINDVYEQITKG